jgi:hypothetical protein
VRALAENLGERPLDDDGGEVEEGKVLELPGCEVSVTFGARLCACVKAVIRKQPVSKLDGRALMTDITPETLSDLVESQLATVANSRVAARIRQLLVAPYCVDREWDYGEPGTTYPCWTILEHRPSNTSIAYCAQGFGPGDPWGLVFLSGAHMSIGMDSAWYPTLEEAFRESMASGDRL